MINIVEECPEGKEWKFDSMVKYLKLKTSSKSVWFGLGLPTTCFIIWVIIPTVKIYTKEEIKKLERFFADLVFMIWSLLFI